MEKASVIVNGIEYIPKGNNSSPIGIGITTHNRYHLFKKTYEEIKKRTPGAIVVVVDDASDTPVKEADYRFNQNVGIAGAKNKCLELLFKAGVEHLFIFDDDTYPLVDDWYSPYIKAGEPHLNYIFENFASGTKLNDTSVLYKDSKITAYTHTRGCMMYYHRSILEKVGGMDTVFGKWGFEHPSLSDRIFMAGLTSFRYMDIADSSGLFYSDDEQNNNVNTTVRGDERRELVNRNRDLYNERKFTKEYIPFYEKDNIFLTCYFTNVKDTQNNRVWESDIKKLEPLINSLKETRLVVLHDCLEEEDTEKVTFIKVETSINPYFQRWISYRKYLLDNKESIGNVFCIDGTDVEILHEPRWRELGNYIYVGDEPNTLNDTGGWMSKNHPHLAIQDLLNTKGKDYQLLNAGVLGGSVENVVEFLRSLVDFYCLSENDSIFHKTPGAGDTDMGAFNYIARTVFNERLRYGREITTTFKADERNNYSWIKHK